MLLVRQFVNWSSVICGFNCLLSSGVRNMTGIWTPCHRILFVFHSHSCCFSFSMKISSFTIKYFIFLTQLVLLELLRFTCRLSAWIVSLEIRYLPSSDKLLLEISVRISNRFSLLRKCKWSEYRALCSYNIATLYLVRLRAIKTMSKHFLIKDFYIVSKVVLIVRYIYSIIVWSVYNLETWFGDNWSLKLHIEIS